MCTCGANSERPIGRRGVLLGLGGLAVSAPVSAALATCFDPAILASTPTEKFGGHATPPGAMPEPALPGPTVTGAHAGVIRRIDLPAGQKTVALTFDLCQTHGRIAGYDGAIVDVLSAEQVAATFFAGGLWLRTHAQRAVELAADPLFELGNHSWAHADLHAAAVEKIDREILLTETALADVYREAARICGGTWQSARLFRFPYGSCSAPGLARANALGSTVIQWDTVSGDPDGTPAATIIRNVTSHIRPGSIVVMHANGRGTHTADALKTLIPRLRGEGYSFATVSKLIAAGRPESVQACYIDHPGDTGRYDIMATHRPKPPEKRAQSLWGIFALNGQ